MTTISPEDELALKHAKLFQSICPPLYQQTDESRLPKKQFDEVIAWNYGPQGLILQGASGTSKTRCAWMLIQKLICRHICPVITFDCVAFGHAVSKRFSECDGVEDWLLELAEFQGVVFFDDLGKLKITDRAEAELFGIIERRSANLLPIFATTNDTGATLEERMSDNRGPAMIRRLREFCKVIRF